MRLAVLLALVLVGTTGCAAFTDDARADGRVTVAAAFYPLAFVAQRIGSRTSPSRAPSRTTSS
jgi:zinc transport system substrate-binding protein